MKLKMQNKTLLTLVALVLLSSCTNNKGWVYKTNNYDKNNDVAAKTSLKNKTIAVGSFADKRDSVNKDFIEFYAIPLMPFGYQNLNSPETTIRHANSSLWINFNPKDDFAKALVAELNESEIFKEALFLESSTGHDYKIKGELVSTYYNSKLFSYGLSIYGPVLWLVGLPATTVSNELEIKLSVINVKSGKNIFTKHYKADKYKKLGWVYSLPNDFNYSEMLKMLYKDFMSDLQKLDMARE